MAPGTRSNAKNKNNSSNNSEKKPEESLFVSQGGATTDLRSRLLTPGPEAGITPGPEAEVTPRPEAGVTPGAQGNTEAQANTEAVVEIDSHNEERNSEIDRILRIPEEKLKESPHEVLRVSADASEDDKIQQWTKIGCQIHESHNSHPDIKKAYKSKPSAYGIQLILLTRSIGLKDAAELMGVEERWIGPVDNWNGESDLLAELLADDSGNESDSGEGGMEDEFIPPTDPIKQHYASITSVMKDLQLDPTSDRLKSHINEVNEKIENESSADESSHWKIRQEITSHYEMALPYHQTLLKNSEDEEAKAKLSELRAFVEEVIEGRQYPKEWAIMTTGDLIEYQRSRTEIQYPWTTVRNDEGALIIGYRRQGRNGYQVCVERRENERMIRRLEAAWEVLGAQEYAKRADAKNLADKTEWNRDHEKYYGGLLWVTKSQIKLSNIAFKLNKDKTPRKPRGPNADCCALFNGKVTCLTFSNLEKVLGKTRAAWEVKKVCEKDGIIVPWKTQPLATHDSPWLFEKDPDVRRTMKDAILMERVKATSNDAAFLVAETASQNSNQVSNTSKDNRDPTTDTRLAAFDERLRKVESNIDKISSMETSVAAMQTTMANMQATMQTQMKTMQDQMKLLADAMTR